MSSNEIEITSKEFNNEEEAKAFSEEHRGFIETFIVDYKLNARFIVFYKKNRSTQKAPHETE